MTWCHKLVTVTVTQSHVIMEDSRRFWKDDIIQYIIYMLTLRQTYSYL